MTTENLVNNHFNDFPIDYFKITPSDFADETMTASGFATIEEMQNYYSGIGQNYTFDILELDENGYLSTSINEKVNFETKDTTVINCAVGQGKTTAILKKIKQKYDADPDTFFIIAVPLVSLINQYELDLIEIGIDEDDIFNYQNIGSIDIHRTENYVKLLRRVHIVTVNTLLGNAGKDAVMQSDAKYDYLKTLSTAVNQQNKKVFFLFDEIHEAISNFTKTGILHLFFWKNVVRKILVLSATFNVTSIPVIKYLSKLTDNKIKILESERKVVKEQSRLFLHFDNSFSYQPDNQTLLDIVQDSISRGKSIDIISYSKKLVSGLLSENSEVGNMLSDNFGDVKKCVSISIEELDPDDTPENRYDNNSCNVGTNFKSGVNIVKENHSFIIILPPKSARGTYKSKNGIFSEGINSIIQTLARQRIVGDIHIILPNPLELNFDTLPEMTESQKTQFSNAYEDISIPVSSIQTRNNVRVRPNEILKFFEHHKILRDSYLKLSGRLLSPIINANSSNIEPIEPEEYILNNAEKILTVHGFLGRDLSCYVVYAAFTNQFYNARLAGIALSPEIVMDSIDRGIDDAYNLYMGDERNEAKSISKKYAELKNRIINNSTSTLDSTHKRTIKNKIYKLLSDRTELTHKDTSFKFLKAEYNNFNEAPNSYKNEIINKLNEFQNILAGSIKENGEIKYFKSYTEDPIFNEKKEEIFNLINLIKSKNPALNLAYAKFFKDSTVEDIDLKFYNYLVKNLYKTERYQPKIDGITKNYRKIISPYL